MFSFSRLQAVLEKRYTRVTEPLCRTRLPTHHYQLSPTGASRVETCMTVTAMVELLTHIIRRQRLDALHDVISISAHVASSSS